MAYQSQDPLTGLPIEVLIHILSNFSISEFLQLSHTHPIIRDAFRSNAAQICNLAIENDPEFKIRVYSQGIRATKVNKWLVPKSFPIIVNPTIARRIFTKKVFVRLGTPSPVEISKSWLVGNVDIAWNTAGMKIKLYEPGPQFLSFLEWQRNEVADPDVEIEDWGMVEFPRLCGLWTMRFLTSREEKL
ncbi:hypothetical protein L207DRAFT_591910 [Hyaloscypha variabilis F]|uniref:F-box domain-containing protein n=1 Tax=Hyaloscypha variabilis (strain UAMH 11265 / GT02V1 / F) TaxID=1149755 RepID=A0A2J6QXG7_HYAVF|nr:hypothetical protein L207DRAFT_591910 [Hyaloscypha variabilis F]